MHVVSMMALRLQQRAEGEGATAPPSVRVPTPGPVSLGKARAVLDFDSAQETTQVRKSGGTPGAAALTDVDRWFETMRPPAPEAPPDLPEARELRPAPRQPSAARLAIGWLALMVLLGASVCILGAAAVVRMRAGGHVKVSAAEAVERSAAAAAPIVVPVAAPAPESVAPVPSDSPGSGELQLAMVARGQRVIVDGRAVGQGPRRIRLSCGAHTVRFGPGGKVRPVIIPCGGQVTLTP